MKKLLNIDNYEKSDYEDIGTTWVHECHVYRDSINTGNVSIVETNTDTGKK